MTYDHYKSPNKYKTITLIRVKLPITIKTLNIQQKYINYVRIPDDNVAKKIYRNKDRQIEESAEKNEEELKFFKQKVKHLQYEHQNNLTECKAEALVSLKNGQNEHTEQEKELLNDKKTLKIKIRELENSYEDQIKNMKMVTLDQTVELLTLSFFSGTCKEYK